MIIILWVFFRFSVERLKPLGKVVAFLVSDIVLVKWLCVKERNLDCLDLSRRVHVEGCSKGFADGRNEERVQVAGGGKEGDVSREEVELHVYEGFHWSGSWEGRGSGLDLSIWGRAQKDMFLLLRSRLCARRFFGQQLRRRMEIQSVACYVAGSLAYFRACL